MHIVLTGDYMWGFNPYKDDCLNKTSVDNLRLSVDKWQSLWKTLSLVRFFTFEAPPYLGGSFEAHRDIEKAIYPLLLWTDCGKVMQILSTGWDFWEIGASPTSGGRPGGQYQIWRFRNFIHSLHSPYDYY